MATSKTTSKSLIPVRKPVPRKAAAPAVASRPVPAKPAAVAKADKPRKLKLVRDSFTIPKAEFAVLQELKQRAGKGGAAAKKSEILRAGIQALAAMSDAAFAAALRALPAIKAGRPAKE